jgi:hypothetical protein
VHSAVNLANRHSCQLSLTLLVSVVEIMLMIGASTTRTNNRLLGLQVAVVFSATMMAKGSHPTVLADFLPPSTLNLIPHSLNLLQVKHPNKTMFRCRIITPLTATNTLTTKRHTTRLMVYLIKSLAHRCTSLALVLLHPQLKPKLLLRSHRRTDRVCTAVNNKQRVMMI